MSTRAVDPARSRIVLVGTPAYDDPALPDVPVVANNIADLAEVLTDPHLGGFSATRCTVAPARAGISQIGDLLHDAADEAEDLLLFYYSGHGLLGPLRQELYLSLAGTKPNRLAFTALPFDAVRDACLASRARSRVVILDSCFSGRAIGTTLAGMDETILGQIQVRGTYTLTSSPANRTALIIPGERHTAFTGRLLKLLRYGSSMAGPLISLGDIYRQLYAQLSSEGLPVPQQRGTETADLLGLVRNYYLVAPPPPTPPTPPAPPPPQPGTPFDFKGLFGTDFEKFFGRGDGTARGADIDADTFLEFADAVVGATTTVTVVSEGKHRRIEARIPPGVKDGQRVVLKGKGEASKNGGAPGDLFVRVHVKPHAFFGRNGDNITVTVPVTFPEAVLGANIKVPTCGGAPVTVKVRRYSASGRVLRVRGLGVPRSDGTAGDMLAQLEIAVPAVLPQEAERALRRYQGFTRDHLPRAEVTDPVFTDLGELNLGVSVPVTFPEAVLGAEIEVPRRDRTPIKVKLPPNSADYRMLRVRGHGSRGDGQRGDGDLLVTFRIAVPAELPAGAVEALIDYQAATTDHRPRIEAFGEL